MNSRSLTCWAVTTGEAGMRSQVLGLAEALAAVKPLEIVEKSIGLRAPWSWLPAALCPFPLMGLDPARAQLSAPWPDVLIACGRRSVAAALAVKRLSGGKTLTVYIQNPQNGASGFDLVIPMTHDGLSGPNVLSTDTALHRVTPATLAQGVAQWGERFSTVPRPLVGVVLGGKNRSYDFTPDIALKLLSDLEKLHRDTGAGLAITASRRTEAEVRSAVTRFAEERPWVYVWDDQGDNPYFGILGLSDALILTADSVSMVSEALATGKPVATVRLSGKGRRHELFLARLESIGATVPFNGTMPTLPATTLPNATLLARNAVMNLLAARKD